MSCILPHRGIQLRLSYSWARPAILAAGKGRGGYVFISSVSSFSFSFLFLPCPFLSSPLLSLFCTVILSLPLIQEGHLSVSGERMCTILVNRLED